MEQSKDCLEIFIQLDDYWRIEFYHGYIGQLHRAIVEDGVNVIGYTGKKNNWRHMIHTEWNVANIGHTQPGQWWTILNGIMVTLNDLEWCGQTLAIHQGSVKFLFPLRKILENWSWSNSIDFIKDQLTKRNQLIGSDMLQPQILLNLQNKFLVNCLNKFKFLIRIIRAVWYRSCESYRKLFVRMFDGKLPGA